MAMDKINQMSMGEKLVSGGGILMLIASILPWHRVSFDSDFLDLTINRSAWQSPDALWSILATLIAVALAASVLAVKFANVQLPALGSITWGTAYGAGGAAVALFVLLKLISETDYLGYGLYLGIVAAAAIAYGGYLLYSEEKSGVRR